MLLSPYGLVIDQRRQRELWWSFGDVMVFRFRDMQVDKQTYSPEYFTSLLEALKPSNSVQTMRTSASRFIPK